MSIEVGNVALVAQTTMVKIPNFISIGGKSVVSASFDFSECPVELQTTILRFIEQSQLSLHAF